MVHSGFKVSLAGGSGCFNCGICGRKTRNVGQASGHLCGFCDEWAMTENSLNDDGLGMDEDDRKTMLDYILKNKVAAAKLGGDLGALQLEKNSDGVWVNTYGPWPWEKQGVVTLGEGRL